MKKTHVVLHHSFTKDSGSVSWGAIRKFHKSWRYEGRIIPESEGRDRLAHGESVMSPWTDIGYHIGVENIDGHYEVLLGRPLDADGAHAYQKNMNRVGLGVLFIGDFDIAPPNTGMLIAMAVHLRPIMELLRIPAQPTRVIGHREVAGYKTCPGNMFDVGAFIDLLRP